MLVSQQKIRREIKRLVPELYRAFLRDVKARKITAKQIEELLDNLDELDALLDFQESDLAEVMEIIRSHVQAGGNLEAVAMGVGYTAAGSASALWMIDRQRKLLDIINNGQRAAAREMVIAGGAANARAAIIAADVQRVIGLSAPQGRAVANAIYALRSGEPAKMRSYLGNKLRNRAFDSKVKKAMAGDYKLTSADIHAITDSYQERLLRYRADVLANTETREAVNAGRMLSVQQQVDEGALEGDTVFKVWEAILDDRVRDDHEHQNGVRVPLDEPFTMPDGTQMMYPGDSSMGAGADQIANCRCEYTIVRVRNG